ncbi:MAG TPA: carboxypeptidase regulatory-like domain-containing protein [Kofleriaceae bacterium]|nr:carboxypeptidase regulatory-like domain-containing protein [Kofleriaceae bacterium]
MRVALVVLFAVATADAAPVQVEIKAQTQLQLDRVRLQADGVAEVSGQLVDKFTGEGIPDQVVTVRIAGQSVTAQTDSNGRFHTTVEVPPGSQSVELAFHGANLLDRSQFATTTDPSRATIALTIGVEQAPAGAKIVVHATADDQPAPLDIDLQVGPPGDDKQLRPLARVRSETPFLLKRSAAGGPGPKHVRATFRGDDAQQPATADVTLELSSSTTTTMAIDKTSIAYEDDLVVTGKVMDDDDRPVAHAAVTLTSGDRRLAQAATTDDGAYKFKVEGQILGQGQFGVQVQSESGKSFVTSSRSAPIVVKIAAPQPVPVSYTIAAFIATAFAAGGFFMARAKPWQRFAKKVPPAEDKHDEDSAEEVHAGGLVVAKPGIVSTLRRPNDDGFSGVVRETVRGRPVPQAVVRLLLDDAEREVRTSNDGVFALERLTAGDWKAEVAAPGHVTERFVVTIPHRGELRGVRIDLVPVRERVFQLYRRAAEPVLPESRLWGIWSPRQIVDHVRSKRPSPALAELTDFVEEIYFSPRLAAEDLLVQAEVRVDRAIHERASVAS